MLWPGCPSAWIYDQDPLQPLRFAKPLAALKTSLATGEPVFQRLVRALLLENPHRVTVTLVPDTTLEQQALDSETAELAAVQAAMGPADLAAVVDRAAELQRRQATEDTAEAVATIPTLTRADIDPAAEVVPFAVAVAAGGGATIVSHELPANGIVYTDVAFDLTAVPFEDVGLLPLFSRLLLDTGTSAEDRVSLARRIGATTGGISATHQVFPKISLGGDGGAVTSDPDGVVAIYVLSGKATADRASDLLRIMAELLVGAQLSLRSRAVELLQESSANAMGSVAGMGHAYAQMRISGAQSLAGHVGELTGGLSHLETLDGLLQQAESDAAWPALLARLERIRTSLLASPVRPSHSQGIRLI